MRGLGVGFVSSWSGVSKDVLGLFRCDELNDDFFGLEREIPKRLCSVLRVPEGFGVSSLAGGTGTGIADGRFLGRGVPGVTVVFVVVVVDDKGLEGNREGGFEAEGVRMLSVRV